MRLTQRQRNIANPFYREYTYSWESKRNRIVLLAIHDYVTKLYLSPSVGHILIPSSLGIGAGDSLKKEDLEAYLALYPQNGIIKEDKIDFISSEKSLVELQKVAQKIKEMDPEGTTITQNFTSDTTPEAVIPPAHNPIPQARNLSVETIMARLIAFPEPSSKYTLALRAIMGRTDTMSSYSALSSDSNNLNIPFSVNNMGTSGNLVNIYDWRKNIEPGNITETTYYNPDYNSYYFLKRTNSTTKTDYDISLPTTVASQNKITAMRSGVQNILKMLGANIPDVVDDILGQPEIIRYETYISERPADRWVYAIIIAKDDIEDIVRGVSGPSFGDDIFVTDFVDTLNDTNKVNVSSFVTLGDKKFSNNYSAALSLLRYYQTSFNSQMITPEMLGGFDIAGEIAKLESFQTSLSTLAEIKSITWQNNITSPGNPVSDFESKIEIKLGTQKNTIFLVANGIYVYEPLGVTPFTPGNDASENITGTAQSLRVPNIFSACTPRTFGLVENLHALAAEYKKDPNQRLPWSEFVKTMIFPKVEVSSRSEQEEIRKRIQIGFEPTKVFGTNIFQAAEERVPLDSVQLNRTFWQTRYAFQNVRSQLQKATDGCDSGLSKLTKAVDQFWPLIQKEDWLAAGLTAASFIKKELVKDKAHQEMISNAEMFVNPNNPLNPLGSAAASEARRWLDEEVSCLIDNLGKLTAETVLPPGADPGDGTKLIKTVGSSFPLSFDFSRTTNLSRNSFFVPTGMEDTRIWKPIRKALLKQIERLMMQLILAVLQDLLKALLGCGYGESSAESNNPALYGFGNINTGFYKLKDPDDLEAGFEVLTDIIPIAKKIGFVNRQLDDSFSVVESDVTHEQLISLNNDISRITTPQEVRLLLNGDAPEPLLFAIVEMINKGQVDMSGIPRNLQNDPIIISIRQESFAPEDVRYAMLGIDKDNIKEYLFQIGQLLPQEQKDEIGDPPVGDPQNEFCEVPRPPRQDVSEEQVLLNLNASIVAKQKDLENLCEMFNFNNPLQGALDGFWEFLEVPDWYKAGLDAIAEFMQWIMAQFESEQGDLGDSPLALASVPYFENTVVGKQILLDNPQMYDTVYFPQYVVNEVGDGNVDVYCASPQTWETVSTDDVLYNPRTNASNRVYISSVSSPVNEYSPPSWTDEEKNLFEASIISGQLREQVIFRIQQNQVNFYLRDNLTGTENLLVNHSLASSNAIYVDRPLDQNPPESGYTIGTNGLSLRDLRTPEGTFPSPGDRSVTAPEGTLDDAESVAVINNLLLQAQQVDALKGAKFVSMPKYTSWTLTEWFYYSANLKWRLKPFGAALGRPFLVESDDCRSVDEIRMATMICEPIWARIKKFMWNIGPLFSSYPNINMPDCVEVLGGYLYQKHEHDLEQKGILGLMLENLWTVEKNYRTVPDNDIIPWRSGGDEQSIMVGQYLAKYISPRDKLKGLFTLSLIGALKRLALEDSFSGSPPRNPLLPPYTSESTTRGYQLLDPLVYDALAQAYGDSFTYVQNSTTWRKRNQYFTPVPLMIAQQYIAFDRIANPIGSVKQKNQRYEQAIAQADDNILNTMRGFGAGKNYENLFQGYPVTVGAKKYYSQNEVDLDIERINFLMPLMDRIDSFEELWVSKTNAADMLRREAEAEARADLDNLREVQTIYSDAGRMFATHNIPMAAFIPAYPPAKHGFVSWDVRGAAYVNEPIDLQKIKDRTGDHTWYSKYEEGRESGLISPDEPSTIVLWGVLSAARSDVGPIDDPTYVNFWKIVNKINKKIDDATNIYKELAQVYYDFQQEYKQLFQTLSDNLSTTGITNYENILSWMSSTFSLVAFTASDEAMEVSTTGWAEDMPFWAPVPDSLLHRGTGTFIRSLDRYDQATKDRAISKEIINSHLEMLQKV